MRSLVAVLVFLAALTDLQIVAGILTFANRTSAAMVAALIIPLRVLLDLPSLADCNSACSSRRPAESCGNQRSTATSRRRWHRYVRKNESYHPSKTNVCQLCKACFRRSCSNLPRAHSQLRALCVRAAPPSGLPRRAPRRRGPPSIQLLSTGQWNHQCLTRHTFQGYHAGLHVLSTLPALDSYVSSGVPMMGNLSFTRSRRWSCTCCGATFLVFGLCAVFVSEGPDLVVFGVSCTPSSCSFTSSF